MRGAGVGLRREAQLHKAVRSARCKPARKPARATACVLLCGRCMLWFVLCGAGSQLKLMLFDNAADPESGAIMSDGKMFKKAVLTPEEIQGRKKKSVNVQVRARWPQPCSLHPRSCTCSEQAQCAAEA